MYVILAIITSLRRSHIDAAAVELGRLQLSIDSRYTAPAATRHLPPAPKLQQTSCT